MRNIFKKRAGFGTLFLCCLLPLIFSTLALASKSVFEFVERIDPIIERERERADTERIIKEEINALSQRVRDGFHLGVVSIDPQFSNKLLVASDGHSIAAGALEISVYSMNYTLSQIPTGDVANFPPSKKTENGEHHFFVKSTRKTSGVLAYRTEAAVEVSGDVADILWWREFVIY